MERCATRRGLRQDASVSPLRPRNRRAGIAAYRTNFTLNISADVDAPISLNFTGAFGNNYRSVIFVNGWQFGRYNALIGPQTLFPVRGNIAVRLHALRVDDVVTRFLKAYSIIKEGTSCLSLCGPLVRRRSRVSLRCVNAPQIRTGRR